MLSVVSSVVRWLGTGALTLALTGCSTDPEIEDFQLDSGSVARGERLSGSYTVTDYDLKGGKAVTTVRVGTESKSIDFKFDDESSKAKVVFSFEILPTAKAKTGAVDAQVFDGDGHASEVQTIEFDITD